MRKTGPGQSIVQILTDMLVGPVEPFAGKGALSQPVVSNRSCRPTVDPLGVFLECVQGLLVSSGSQEREPSHSLTPGMLRGEILAELEDLFPIRAWIWAKGCGSDLIEGRFEVAGGVLAEHFLAKPFIRVCLTALKLQDGYSIPRAEPLVPHAFNGLQGGGVDLVRLAKSGGGLVPEGKLTVPVADVGQGRDDALVCRSAGRGTPSSLSGVDSDLRRAW